jgi:hypothetical protein
MTICKEIGWNLNGGQATFRKTKTGGYFPNQEQDGFKKCEYAVS